MTSGMRRLAVALAFVGVVGALAPPPLVKPSKIQKVLSFNASSLYELEVPGFEGSLRLADLHGSRYDMGFAYGKFLGNSSVQDMHLLLDSQVPNKFEQLVLSAFLDLQWDHFLSKNIPETFLEELKGLDDGATEAGAPDAGKLVRRGLVISGFPGDVGADIKWLVINELKSRDISEDEASLALENLLGENRPALLRRRCSQLAAWSDRVLGGGLLQTRNLDWAADTGIAANKVIVVWHPENAVAHAAAGFAGLYGSLVGMSAAGVTVGESGDDNTRETFQGMPWVLRLRALMETATTLAEARSFWSSTNNTMGINHVVGAASDPAAMALETCAGYTAYFGANDTRERDATAQDKSGHPERIGFPLPNAVWRTNHGYDPTWLKTAMRQNSPTSDTQVRYDLFHEALVNYERAGVRLSLLEAANMTKLVGDKGGSDRQSFLHCVKGKGSTILSVAMDPSNMTMAVAFEQGAGADRWAACCANYVVLDMKTWMSR
mmetsp:Transcript_57157/g.134534  ORF Transcript_57157/g.134534 Transcript_57157/m.134534 type:complete len:492 (-) Transcript_57157:53-1528(-)